MATQIKNIPLKGLATSPSDFTCEDGVSAMALNMLRKDGSFVGAIHSAPELIEDTDGANIIFQHKNSNYANFIYKGADGKVYFKKKSELGTVIDPSESIIVRKSHPVSIKAYIELDNGGTKTKVDNGGSLTIYETPLQGSSSERITPVVSVFVDNRLVSVSRTFVKKYCGNASEQELDIETIDGSEPTISVREKGTGNYWWEYVLTINGHTYNFVVSCVVNFGYSAYFSKENADANHTLDIIHSYTDPTVSVEYQWTYTDPLDPDNDEQGDGQVQIEAVEHGTASVEIYQTIGGVSTLFGTISYTDAPLIHPYRYCSSVTDNTPSSFTTEEEYKRYFDALEGKTINIVVNVKNILVFYTDTDVYYYLYVGTADGAYYKPLGTALPTLDLQFSLEGHFYSNHVSRSVTDKMNDGDIDMFDPKDLDKDVCTHIRDWDEVTTDSGVYKDAVEALLGEGNLFCGGAARKGYFSQPFLVRYAFRLFDGSLTRVSAPVLMMPANKHNPVNFVKAMYYHSDASHVTNPWTRLKVAAQGIVAKLRYSCVQSDIELIKDWKEIISGVEIYVSRPIYTYKQDSGKLSDMIHPVLKPTTAFTSTISDSTTEIDFHSIFQIEDEEPKRRKTYTQHVNDLRVANGFDPYTPTGTNTCENTETGASLPLPPINPLYCSYALYAKGICPYIGLDYKTDKDIRDEIETCSDFYMIADIDIDNLEASDHGVNVPLKEGALVDVSTGKALVEDYDSWHRLLPMSALVYNQRLSMANVQKRFFDGFSLSQMVQDCKATTNRSYLAVAYIEDGDTMNIVCAPMSLPLADLLKANYLYYPDASAKKIEVYYVRSGSVYVKDYPLHVHSMLNGSCYVADTIDASDDTPTLTAYTSLEQVKALASKTPVRYASTLYTSEVYNPFVFLASNVTDIGDGTIYAIVPITQALSNGQYSGDAMRSPVIAFCSDGLWALKLSATGGFSAVQPISRDVLLGGKPTNILQLDQQILFCSERGLMSITGTNVECISERFDGDHDKFRLRLAGEWHDAHAWIMDNVASGDKVSALELYITDEREDTGGTTEKRLLLDTPFKEVIKDAVLLYDYRHSRVIVGWRDKPLAYVLDLKDGEWTTIVQRITSAINSYPDCYAMTSVLRDDGEHFWTDTKCVDFSAESADEHFGFDSDVYMPFPGLYMTRTLSLGDSTALKVIRTLNVQGRFANSHVGIILLGSNDNAMNDWVVLASVVGGRMAFRNGTPMKHFRLLIPCQLAKGEDVSSVTVEFEVKEPQNKLRQ